MFWVDLKHVYSTAHVILTLQADLEKMSEIRVKAWGRVYCGVEREPARKPL